MATQIDPTNAKQLSSVKKNIEETINALNESADFNESIKNEINPKIKEKVLKAGEYRKKSKKALLGFTLSTASEKTRKAVTYFKKGEDDLDKKVKTIITEGIKFLKTSGSKKGFKVNLPEQEFTSYLPQLKESNKPGSSYRPSDVKGYKPLNDFINSGGSLDVPSVSDCLVQIKAREKADSILSPGANGSIGENKTGNPESSENETTEIPAADELIKQKVAVQMDYVTSPEEQVRFGVTKRSSEADIVSNIKSFELTGGPADVTSYHDFYDLQIAFKHVWTELSDNTIKALAETLYSKYLEIKDNWYDKEKWDHEAGTINSIEELKGLMNSYRQALVVAANNDASYFFVKKFLAGMTIEDWIVMDVQTRNVLVSLANRAARLIKKTEVGDYVLSLQEIQQLTDLTLQGLEILQTTRRNKQTLKRTRVENFLEDLEQILSEPCKFDVFAPDTVNFGILVNYKQRWEPSTYQVGELVSTIPLAPREVRRYTTKRVIKKSRAVKEIENSVQIRKEESSNTGRVDAEIVRQATNKTNFKMNAEGGVNFAVWNAKGSHEIGVESSRQSNDVKKEFREAVIKAAQEYKNEHSLDITTSASEEYEETTSGEISNPNDELPVTYLFYELQRRFEISEKIHKITPVILVANDVPYPDEIDEAWLLSHDWILRRVILDDSFLPALDYLSKNFVSDEISTEVLRDKMLMQIQVVKDIAKQVKISGAAVARAQSAMEKAIDAYAMSKTSSDGGSGFFDFVFNPVGTLYDEITGSNKKGNADSETYRIRMEAAKEAFTRIEQKQKEAESLIKEETTALEVATDKFLNKVQEQYDRRTAILRLRVHVKDNILYYMQAIWDQEPPDQRFFRLYDKPVDDIEIKNIEFSVSRESNKSIKDTLKKWNGADPYRFRIIPKDDTVQKTLVEIADLDNLLGYKGNYMIFPLRKNNAVTLYMMQDYIQVDDIVHLSDPDDPANYTTEELIEIMKCQYKNDKDKLTDEVKQWYEYILIQQLSNPTREKEMVVVPTNSLYIEALPGKHPILEDFKLVHRATDVKKVQAEVRKTELENVRLAARTLKGDYEDPDIEKKIVIEGNGKSVVIPNEN